ncbi:MAG: nucleoside triphosphate pyrophosphohydrolase [Hyphomicrobiaceae bacterium]
MSEAQKSVVDLLAVMAALRTPGTGCPWDLEQTFRTIAPYTIEEAYEVADAIARGDLGDLKEELGDLLLQVVYHARMAEEQGAFAFPDVAEAVTAKMVRRHPHVFGTPEQRAAGVKPGFWERIKADERAGREGKAVSSALDGVPVGLPALTRAVKLQDKAARVGFDWPSLRPVLDKVKEELAELEAEIAAAGQGPGQDRSHAKVEEELGDLLFAVANVARHLMVDPEAALRAANGKFTRRFRAIEEKLAALGRTPAQSTLAEMDALWDEAKAEEKR